MITSHIASVVGRSKCNYVCKTVSTWQSLSAGPTQPLPFNVTEAEEEPNEIGVPRHTQAAPAGERQSIYKNVEGSNDLLPGL